MANPAAEDKWKQIDVDKLKARDTEQLSELATLLLPRIRLYAISYLKSVGVAGYYTEADDIAQEAILTIFSSLHKYEPAIPGVITYPHPDEQPEYKRFQSWCYRVALNLIRLKAKTPPPRSRHARELNEKELLPPPLSAESAYESVLLLEEFLQSIEPNAREIFSMYFQHGLSSREVAEALGISEAAVRRTVLRTRRKLLERINKSRSTGGTLNVATEPKEAAS